MQSRLAISARRSTNSFFSSQALRRGLASATYKHTADPAVHAVDYGDDPALFPVKPEESTQSVNEPKPAKQETDDAEYSKPRNNASGTDPLTPLKPPHATFPRLESTGVNQPLDPTVQQKRSHSSSTITPAIEDVSCAGLDGTPWPKEKEENEGDIEAQLEDDTEYFKHHKASPLSEIKVADTRKPITRATDGTANDSMGTDVTGWRPEQLDTADEALRRATKIFTMNAMRAFPDPDAPHSRVLRSLRGENF